MTTEVTAEEFLSGYMQRAVDQGHHLPSVTIHLAHRNVVPCSCGNQGCQGWAVVPLGWTDWRGP